MTGLTWGTTRSSSATPSSMATPSKARRRSSRSARVGQPDRTRGSSASTHGASTSVTRSSSTWSGSPPWRDSRPPSPKRPRRKEIRIHDRHHNRPAPLRDRVPETRRCSSAVRWNSPRATPGMCSTPPPRRSSRPSEERRPTRSTRRSWPPAPRPDVGRPLGRGARAAHPPLRRRPRGRRRPAAPVDRSTRPVAGLPGRVPSRSRWRSTSSCVGRRTLKVDRTIHLGGYDKPAPTQSDVVYEPVGVVAAITGYNYPLNLAIFKFGAALAAGCTVVSSPVAAYPADDTPARRSHPGGRAGLRA